MTEDRWSLRGVSADLQRAVTGAAKREGRTVGRWVSDALQAALVGQIADSRRTGDEALGATVATLAQRLTAVEARLAEVECRTTGEQSADTVPVVAAGSRRPGGGQTADMPIEAATMAQEGHSAPPKSIIAEGAQAISSEHSTLTGQIQAARQARGMTQRQLAEAAGVPQSAISQMERGELRETAGNAEHVVRVRAALELGGVDGG